MLVHIVIPARYASSRLPGKPLADIAGEAMVVRVARQAGKAGSRQRSRRSRRFELPMQ